MASLYLVRGPCPEPTNNLTGACDLLGHFGVREAHETFSNARVRRYTLPARDRARLPMCEYGESLFNAFAELSLTIFFTSESLGKTARHAVPKEDLAPAEFENFAQNKIFGK